MTSSSAVAVLSGATILPRLQQIKAENKHEGIYMASINHILCYAPPVSLAGLRAIPSVTSAIKSKCECHQLLWGMLLCARGNLSALFYEATAAAGHVCGVNWRISLCGTWSAGGWSVGWLAGWLFRISSIFIASI